MDEIIIYKSRWKAIRLMLFASVFVLASFWMLAKRHHTAYSWVYWTCAGFFGLCYPIGLFNLFDRRPQIIINETGIFDRNAYKDFVNWNTIDHAYWTTVHRQPFVCLILKDEFKELIKSNSKMKQVNLAMGFQEVNINLSSVSNVDQEKLTALIINLANAKPVDRSKLLKSANKLHD